MQTPFNKLDMGGILLRGKVAWLRVIVKQRELAMGRWNRLWCSPVFQGIQSTEQIKKYDRELNYVKKWVPEFGTSDYVQPIVEHTSARRRALETYKKAIESRWPGFFVWADHFYPIAFYESRLWSATNFAKPRCVVHKDSEKFCWAETKKPGRSL